MFPQYAHNSKEKKDHARNDSFFVGREIPDSDSSEEEGALLFSNERVSSDTTKVAMRILRCPMPMDIPENKFHPFLLDLFTVENEIFKKSSVNIQNHIFNASQLSNNQKGKITMINCHVCWSLSLQLRDFVHLEDEVHGLRSNIGSKSQPDI